MARNYSMSFEMQLHNESTYIEINGVRYTMAQYKEMKKAKEKAAKKEAKKKREQTMIQALPEYIRKMIKHIKVLKSLAAFYDNGYRQWGIICRDILNNPMIVGDYAHFRVLAHEMEQILADIEKIGKKNEKNVFQYIEKLSYKIDDMKETMDKLAVDVWNSRVCEFYKGHECINGNGRRLGLEVIMQKSLLSSSEIQKLIRELTLIGRGGLDSSCYNHFNGHYNGVNF